MSGNRSDWRPEQELKDAAYSMLSLIFDPLSLEYEWRSAATTLVEIIQPELLAEATEDLQQEWDATATIDDGLPERVEHRVPCCPWCGKKHQATKGAAYTKVLCSCGWTFEAEKKVLYVSRPLEHRE